MEQMVHTPESVKEWLRSYGELIADVDNLCERAEILREKASSPSSPSLDGMPHEKGGHTDRIGHLIAQCDFLEREASTKFQKARVIYKEIDTAVKQIKGHGWAHKKAVLQMRYLDLASWDEVLDMLFIKKPDFLDKEDTYRRRVFKIHQEAVQSLTEILNQNTERKPQNDER